jgi:hypothetical protein
MLHWVEVHRNVEYERKIKIIINGDRKWESFRHCESRNYTDVCNGEHVVAALPHVTFGLAVL